MERTLQSLNQRLTGATVAPPTATLKRRQRQRRNRRSKQRADAQTHQDRSGSPEPNYDHVFGYVGIPHTADIDELDNYSVPRSDNDTDDGVHELWMAPSA